MEEFDPELDLSEYKVNDLRKFATNLNLPNRSNRNKQDLYNMLSEHYAQEGPGEGEEKSDDDEHDSEGEEHGGDWKWSWNEGAGSGQQPPSQQPGTVGAPAKRGRKPKQTTFTTTVPTTLTTTLTTTIPSGQRSPGRITLSDLGKMTDSIQIITKGRKGEITSVRTLQDLGADEGQASPTTSPRAQQRKPQTRQQAQPTQPTQQTQPTQPEKGKGRGRKRDQKVVPAPRTTLSPGRYVPPKVENVGHPSGTLSAPGRLGSGRGRGENSGRGVQPNLGRGVQTNIGSGGVQTNVGRGDQAPMNEYYDDEYSDEEAGYTDDDNYRDQDEMNPNEDEYDEDEFSDEEFYLEDMDPHKAGNPDRLKDLSQLAPSRQGPQPQQRPNPVSRYGPPTYPLPPPRDQQFRAAPNPAQRQQPPSKPAQQPPSKPAQQPKPVQQQQQQKPAQPQQPSKPAQQQQSKPAQQTSKQQPSKTEISSQRQTSPRQSSQRQSSPRQSSPRQSSQRQSPNQPHQSPKQFIKGVGSQIKEFVLQKPTCSIPPPIPDPKTQTAVTQKQALGVISNYCHDAVNDLRRLGPKTQEDEDYINDFDDLVSDRDAQIANKLDSGKDIGDDLQTLGVTCTRQTYPALRERITKGRCYQPKQPSSGKFIEKDKK